MKDLEISLNNKPGSLAAMGRILGENNISLEGGGVFNNGAHAIAHFLMEDAEKACEVLKATGINALKINEVIMLKLRQDVPGQLGEFCQRLSNENVNILTQYSDHSNQLVVVTDNHPKAKEIAGKWMKEWW